MGKSLKVCQNVRVSTVGTDFEQYGRTPVERGLLRVLVVGRWFKLEVVERLDAPLAEDFRAFDRETQVVDRVGDADDVGGVFGNDLDEQVPFPGQRLADVHDATDVQELVHPVGAVFGGCRPDEQELQREASCLVIEFGVVPLDDAGLLQVVDRLRTVLGETPTLSAISWAVAFRASIWSSWRIPRSTLSSSAILSPSAASLITTMSRDRLTKIRCSPRQALSAQFLLHFSSQNEYSDVLPSSSVSSTMIGGHSLTVSLAPQHAQTV